MIPGEPSRTARAAATHRAAHQILEAGRIFTDPLALRILAATPADVVADPEASLQHRPMRLFIAARHRLAEDAVAAAVARGLRQVVVLGAGLDTQAYRSPHGEAVTYFEVDHPATAAWKQQRLHEADIPIPASLRFATIDFETEHLPARLEAAGFDPAAPSFFVWLGVVPYLTEAAIFETIRYISSLPGQAELVFDYGDPPDTMPPEQREALEARVRQAASIGEPWLSFFSPAALITKLHAAGFTTATDHPASFLIASYLGLPPPPSALGAHIMHAATQPTHP